MRRRKKKEERRENNRTMPTWAVARCLMRRAAVGGVSFSSERNADTTLEPCCRNLVRAAGRLYRQCVARSRSIVSLLPPRAWRCHARLVVVGTWCVSGDTCGVRAQGWPNKPSGVDKGEHGGWRGRRESQGTGVAGGPAGGIDRLN